MSASLTDMLQLNRCHVRWDHLGRAEQNDCFTSVSCCIQNVSVVFNMNFYGADVHRKAIAKRHTEHSSIVIKFSVRKDVGLAGLNRTQKHRQ